MENINLHELSDSELVKLSIDEKSNDAYSELVKRWINAVRYSAYEVTGNGDQAEDIAQEAFFVCWIKLHMLREYEKFGMWVCRTSKNYALNLVSRSTVNYSLDTVLNVSSKRSSPENIIIVRETKEQINSSLKNLPENLRKPAEMFYITGLSQKKIASLLNIPEGTVKRRLFDARNRLRSELEKLGVLESQRDNKITGDKIMKKEFIEKVDPTDSDRLYRHEQMMFSNALNAFISGDFEESKKCFIETAEFIKKNDSSPHYVAIGYIAANPAGLKAIDYLEKNSISDDSHIIIFKSFYGTRMLHDSTQTKLICNPGLNSRPGLADDNERPIERLYFEDVLLNVTIDQRYFTHGMNIGDRIISEDGNSTLELVSVNETVTVNAGTYTNCCKFIKTISTRENYKVEIWYCPNVGLLKADFSMEEINECYELSECTINGGEGLLPFAKGNKWNYILSGAPESLVQFIEYEVEEDDGNFASVSSVNIFSFKR